MTYRRHYIDNDLIRPLGHHTAKARGDYPIFRTDYTGRVSAAREIFDEEDGWVVAIVISNEMADPVVREWLRSAVARRVS